MAGTSPEITFMSLSGRGLRGGGAGGREREVWSKRGQEGKGRVKGRSRGILADPLEAGEEALHLVLLSSGGVVAVHEGIVTQLVVDLLQQALDRGERAPKRRRGALQVDRRDKQHALARLRVTWCLCNDRKSEEKERERKR